MKPEDETHLEAEIDRELKFLTELAAPADLTTRVMRQLGKPATAAPWYKNAWPHWPLGFQATGLAVLVSIFCGICLVVWQLPLEGPWGGAQAQAVKWLAPWNALYELIRALAFALFTTVKTFGAGWLIAWALVAATAYAMCICLATAVFKFAADRR